MTEESHEQREWTPTRGLIHAAIAGMITAAVLSALLTPPAIWMHAVLLNAFCRAFIAFGVAWVLFGVVEYFAGMVGWPVTALACVFSGTVMLSNHLVWAMHGLPIGPDGSIVAGFTPYFTPAFVLMANGTAGVGIGASALLCRDGQPGPDILGYIASQPIWGGRR